MQIAEVVFDIPLDRSFHYLIPAELASTLQVGMRVLVPFGPRVKTGFVVQLLDKSPIRELKPLRRLIDPVPVIAEERWVLAKWIADYYYCSFGEALALMVPSQLRLPSHRDAASSAARQGTLVEGHGVGGVSHEGRAGSLTLTAHQRRAFVRIKTAIDAKKFQTILLHGVTGSGKTELYLQAIDRILQQGRSAICLIPEIALTAQTIDRFRERFGAEVAVWHSRLGQRQRAQTWETLLRGECQIVVGARSAVYVPIQRLGLIILDEEHEQAYKQEGAPHTHAREVALARARLTGAVVLLGSATPAIESYYAAMHGQSQLVTLPTRVKGRTLPKVDIIDMREEFSHGRRTSSPLSGRLHRALERTIERGEQAMLMLNRRGFARVAQCQTCGVVSRCTHCSVPLIYHASQRQLVCHYCNFQLVPPELCESCKKGYVRFRGSGTERVESELHRLFPVASIGRMDRDTTKQRENHRQIYEAVKRRQIGLLVGTQMIAKGFDFPQVTVVGVISADTALNLPDFRSGERTFDLLTQVAGRAGRGEQPGQVFLQTYCPTHYAIQAAQAHDYQRFYDAEIEMRRRVQLPPFVHLIELTLMGASRQKVFEAADALAVELRRLVKGLRMTLLGPAPHRIPRLRRAYRACLLLKGRAVEPMMRVLRGALQPGRRFRGMPVSVNIDPL